MQKKTATTQELDNLNKEENRIKNERHRLQVKYYRLINAVNRVMEINDNDNDDDMNDINEENDLNEEGEEVMSTPVLEEVVPPKKKEREVKFHFPCPENECRGFLSTGYKCGICELKVCSKCHEILSRKNENEINEELAQHKNEELAQHKNEMLVTHKCKQEDVDTVELKKKDCKNCPQCKILIHKVSGCNQMYDFIYLYYFGHIYNYVIFHLGFAISVYVNSIGSHYELSSQSSFITHIFLSG
jgi:hypothetical protein